MRTEALCLDDIHVDRENMSAKFWLDPDVSLEENFGSSTRAH